MLELDTTQLIKISIGNNVILGLCEEQNYVNWIQGHVLSSPLSSSFGPDGAQFDSIHMAIKVSSDTKEIYEKYVVRGDKGIDITIVYRGADSINKSYEVQRIEYKDCQIDYFSLEVREDITMNIIFKCTHTIGVTLHVANRTATEHDKIGPITYDIRKKILI